MMASNAVRPPLPMTDVSEFELQRIDNPTLTLQCSSLTLAQRRPSSIVKLHDGASTIVNRQPSTSSSTNC